MAEGVYTALEKFKKRKDPGQTLANLDKYVKRAELVFTTADVNDDAKKKSFLQIWGGDEMVTLFEHDGKVVAGDTFAAAVKKIKDAIAAQVNEIYPVYKLFCEMPQGNQPFTSWYPKVMEQAKRCKLEAYTAERAARDAMVIQTENNKLRKKALSEGPSYNDFVKAGLAMESSDAQATKMGRADGVNWLKDKSARSNNESQRQEYKGPSLCDFCGYDRKKAHNKGKCPAKGKMCKACDRKGHFAKAKVCPGKTIRRMSDEEGLSSTGSDEDTAGRVILVNQVQQQDKEEEVIPLFINGEKMLVRVDSGCRKVLLPEAMFQKIRKTTKLRKPKVKLRPYGVKENIEVVGRALVNLTAIGGKTISAWIHVVKGHKVEALFNPNCYGGGGGDSAPPSRFFLITFLL